MKRIPAFVLILLCFAWSTPIHAKIHRGPNSAEQTQNAVEKNKQRAAKQRRKGAKKLAKAQRKAAKRHNRA